MVKNPPMERRPSITGCAVLAVLAVLLVPQWIHQHRKPAVLAVLDMVMPLGIPRTAIQDRQGRKPAVLRKALRCNQHRQNRQHRMGGMMIMVRRWSYEHGPLPLFFVSTLA